MQRLFLKFIVILFSAVISVSAFAGAFTDDQKKEMESLIHDYLVAHPEVLQEMVQKLDAQQKQAAADTRNTALSSAAKDIYHNELDGVAGNPKGDVTIVEFMDYNCGWCRKSVKEMQSVVAQDKNVRVVLKEFPIFGEGSEYAARAAMASVKQNKYWAFHQALFAHQGQVDAAATDAIAKSVGLDVAKMKEDMKSADINANIDKTKQLADQLQFTGTPGFIIGDQVFPGYEEQDKILATIANARAGGGCKYC